jgi:hypothetical protein
MEESMRFTRTAILAGGAALLAFGTAAVAADKLHTMTVALPDGSVAHIQYAGDVAPKVSLQPIDAVPVAFVDPFAEFDRIAAVMEAQHQLMMRQVAQMQQAAAQAGSGAPGQVTLVGDLPAGTHFTYVSSTTDANGCTRTVEYSSDGSSQQPKVTKTSAGSCDAAPRDSAPTAASAPAPAAPAAEGPGIKV